MAAQFEVRIPRAVVHVTATLFYQLPNGTWQYLIKVDFNFGESWLEGNAITGATREQARWNLNSRAITVAMEQQNRVHNTFRYGMMTVEEVG